MSRQFVWQFVWQFGIGLSGFQAFRLLATHVIVAFVCLLLGLASATTYPELSLDEMFAKADIIAYGEVTNLEVEERDGEPWTVLRLSISNGIKLTDDEQNSLEFAFLGGRLPTGETINVGLMPQFRTGETLLIFAYDQDYYSPIVGFRQGLWRLGARGLVDETGRVLSLDEEVGELQIDGSGGSTEAILDAIQARVDGAE